MMVPTRLAVICFTYSQTFLLTRAVNLLSERTSDETNNIGYALIGATFFIYMGIAVNPGSLRDVASNTLTYC